MAMEVSAALRYCTHLTHCGQVTPYRFGSTLAQAMVYCLTVPIHYLNQCWLLVNEVLWHSVENYIAIGALTNIRYSYDFNVNAATTTCFSCDIFSGMKYNIALTVLSTSLLRYHISQRCQTLVEQPGIKLPRTHPYIRCMISVQHNHT